MKLRIVALAGAGLIGAASLAGAGFAGPDYRNKYESTSATQDCGDGDTVTYNGPLKMWPPNHKLQDVSVSATDGEPLAEGDTKLTVWPTLTDAAGGDGGPNHDPDYTAEEIIATGDPTATADFWLRAERSGKGEGRTYTINWLAEFGDGKSCSSTDGTHTPFLVEVPHDMRGGANWK
ncbi:MAG TPA: hypothetical protein VF230_16710 [Acidimicrobiales bacterium]